MSNQFQSWKSNPDETHAPLMGITLWSLGGISFAFLAVRCYIRRRQKKFWYDDGLLVVSWVSNVKTSGRWPTTHSLQFLLLGQIILNQLNINLGFGKHALDSK